MRAATRKKSKGSIDRLPAFALKEIRLLSYKTAVPFSKMRDVILGLGIYAAKEQMAALLKEMDAVPNLLKSAIELAKLDPNAEPEPPEIGEKRIEITLQQITKEDELRQLEDNGAVPGRGGEASGQPADTRGTFIDPQLAASSEETRSTPAQVIHQDRGLPADSLVGTAADPPRPDHAGERPEEPGAHYPLDGYIPAVLGGDVLI